MERHITLRQAQYFVCSLRSMPKTTLWTHSLRLMSEDILWVNCQKASISDGVLHSQNLHKPTGSFYIHPKPLNSTGSKVSICFKRSSIISMPKNSKEHASTIANQWHLHPLWSTLKDWLQDTSTPDIVMNWTHFNSSTATTMQSCCLSTKALVPKSGCCSSSRHLMPSSLPNSIKIKDWVSAPSYVTGSLTSLFTASVSTDWYCIGLLLSHVLWYSVKRFCMLSREIISYTGTTGTMQKEK